MSKSLRAEPPKAEVGPEHTAGPVLGMRPPYPGCSRVNDRCPRKATVTATSLPGALVGSHGKGLPDSKESP